MQRRRFKQTQSLEKRLSEEAKRLREEAKSLRFHMALPEMRSSAKRAKPKPAHMAYFPGVATPRISAGRI